MKEKISIEEIEKLADLSKLRFNDEEMQVLVNQVSDIITMLKGCDDVSTSIMLDNKSQRLRDLREDEIQEEMDLNNVLLNAPSSKNGYFVVPKVVD